MDCKPDAGYEIQDTFCGRRMLILKLKLEKGNTENGEAPATNGTTPYGDFNYGTKLLKELVDHWEIKVDIVVQKGLYFASVQSENS